MGKVWRVVESQEQIATLGLVDNMQEQGMLEALLDGVKPRYRNGTENLHYLIKTAFRYPPLKYGSRFGTRTMPSYFYASCEIETALTETAYYRFLFLEHMQTPYAKPIDSEHTAFSVSVRSDKALNLRAERYSNIREGLVNRSDYQFTQIIGQWATEKRGAEMIQFESARRLEYSNLAIAEPACIRSRKPLDYQKWICRTTIERVSFNKRDQQPLIIHRAAVS